MINTKKPDYALILAGGKGRRLWPCSRQALPKQFIDFFGSGRTQLQQTYDRLMKIFPKENILISTNLDYGHLVKEQLPEVADDHIMFEPIHRNTAPSVAWAIHRIHRMAGSANLMVSPSDQAVINEEAFQHNVAAGMAFVDAHDALLTMGVSPTRPEPGYGYIQKGDETATEGLFEVKSFTEKPERAFAEMFMSSGEFLWNTGIFLANTDYLKASFNQLLPPVLRTLDTGKPGNSVDEENEYMRDNFSSYPNLSIDYGILEKSEDVYVMRCDFGWADIGTWHGIYEAASKGEGDNVIIDTDVFLDDCHNNVIKMPKGKLAVLNGLDGFIVADSDNVLLVCKKEDSSALVRKYVNEVQIKKGDEFV